MHKHFLIVLMVCCSVSHYAYAFKIADGGYGHSSIIQIDGSLWMWGNNEFGQLGNGNKQAKTTPIKIGTDTNWIQVSLGNEHSVGLKADGSVWAWGNNQYGQLGLNNTVSQMTPTALNTGGNVIGITAGGYFTLILMDNGIIKSAGKNNLGQLGLGSQTNYEILLTAVSGFNGVINISSGHNHSLLLKNDGTLWAFGSNGFGQLGVGSDLGVISASPIQVGVDTNWAKISAGGFHSLAIKTDSNLWAFGKGTAFQTGLSPSNYTIPTDTGITSVAGISAGDDFSIIVKQDNTIYGMGSNYVGQLAQGNKNKYQSIRQIGLGTDWETVEAGNYHGFAINSGNQLFAWGLNHSGQINSQYKDITSPYQIELGTVLKAMPGSGTYPIKTVGDPLVLDGSASFTSSGNAIVYSWTILSAPTGSLSSISSNTIVNPNILLDRNGIYEIGLEISDGNLSSSDNVIINVDKSKYGSFKWGTNYWSN